MNRPRHPMAGQTVRIKDGVRQFGGAEFEVEDWWENVSGRSWMMCNGNFACLNYAARTACTDIPMDDEVVYGKIGGSGHLFHVSELGEPKKEEEK